MKRTTIEIDEILLERAKRALRLDTTRATVEEALRRVVEVEEDAQGRRVAAQRSYLGNVAAHVDAEVMRTDEAWR